MDISVNNVYKPFKFLTCTLNIQVEGSMSQNFDIDPRFYFMKMNVEIYEQKINKSFPFFYIKVKLRPKSGGMLWARTENLSSKSCIVTEISMFKKLK